MCKRNVKYGIVEIPCQFCEEVVFADLTELRVGKSVVARCENCDAATLIERRKCGRLVINHYTRVIGVRVTR
jgi:hypothetical protein